MSKGPEQRLWSMQADMISMTATSSLVFCRSLILLHLHFTLPRHYMLEENQPSDFLVREYTLRLEGCEFDPQLCHGIKYLLVWEVFVHGVASHIKKQEIGSCPVG